MLDIILVNLANISYLNKLNEFAHCEAIIYININLLKILLFIKTRIRSV